ncbi:MAG: signal peptide peptidase SppA [Polyangiaceae bacterium]|jgi:protease-4
MRTASKCVGRILTATLLIAFPSGSLADPYPVSAEHVDGPARSIASDDTSQAIVDNPANLSWLPGPELRWTFVHCPDDAVKVGCGHAWQVAAPLPFHVGAALRFDLVQPPWGGPDNVGVGYPYRGYDFDWLTFALSVPLGERAAFGMSIERAYSSNSAIDGLFGVSAALSWRPDSHLALAAVARDFNRPSTTLVGPPFEDNVPVLDARYALGLAVRPTGRRDIELGLELQYWQGVNLYTPRGTLGVDVPGVGRIFAGVEVARPFDASPRAVVASAGVELHYGNLSAGGGAMFGGGLGSASTVAEYGTVAIAGYSEPGLPELSSAVWIRIEGVPSTRGHVALLRTLWGLAHRRDVAAVTLVVRAEPASSFAHAEELADALRMLRAYRKKVLCSFEDAGAKALYVCANADRTVVEPAGGVRYSGLSSQYIHVKKLLDKVGVRADFVRVGPHKTAPEQFTSEHAGPVADADHRDLLAQQEAVFVRNLSLYRHMTEERIREETRKGPFVASEARAAGLVDGYAFDDELEHATQELVGHAIPYAKYAGETNAPSVFSGAGKVALLYLDGEIVDGRSQHVPLLDLRLVGSYSMADAIDKLRSDPSVRAVVLRIESPGGSSLASDVMWRALRMLAERKPLIVSMGSVAASGGYYVASASRDIYALPLTVTGSIGVYYGKADLSGLLDKIGVTMDTYRTTPRADGESLFRGFTDEERAELEHKVGQFYDTFLDRVHQRQGMPKEQIDAVGRGRVWTGQQALERHLIDHLGGLREALAAARLAANLPDDAPVIDVPAEEPTLVERLLDLAGARGTARLGGIENLPAPLRNLARSLAPLVVHTDGEALARMEWVEDDGTSGP